MIFLNGNHSTVNDYKNNGWNCRACERMTTKMTKKITSRYRSIPYEDTIRSLQNKRVNAECKRISIDGNSE